jgi:hypothetical protein
VSGGDDSRDEMSLLNEGQEEGGDGIHWTSSSTGALQPVGVCVVVVG